MELLSIIPPLVLYCTIPGGAGGLTLFLYAFQRGHYRNNKYFRKFTIEIIGAMITATFVTALISDGNLQVPLAFAIGIGWSRVVQIIRTKITKVIEAVLGEKLDEGGK